MSIYVANEGQEIGPLTPAEVKELVEAGNLSANDPALLEGDNEWTTVAAVLKKTVSGGTEASTPVGQGVKPMASLSRDFKNLKRNSSTTAGELREFMREMRGKSPREMLGAVAQSTLVQSTLVSTVAVFILLMVLTAVPYAMGDKETEQAADAKKPTKEAGPQPKASSTTAPVAPAKKKAEEVLGVGAEKKGKPTEVNPFENKKGGLLDDPLGGIDID